MTTSPAPSRQRIILASSSPRRQELLQILGLSFRVITPAAPSVTGDRPTAVDETPLPGETPAALVQRLSHLKAEAVAAKLKRLDSSLSSSENSFVGQAFQPVLSTQSVESLLHKLVTATDQLFIIAADTEVALGSQILGKPGNAAAATAMLTALRRQPHHVYSGLTVARLAGADLTFVTRLHQSTVWMRPYTDAEIAAYVASGDPLDKAGGYGIQNKSFAPVARLEGCFASVMGLPLGELAAACRELGLQFPPIAPSCSRYTGHPCCQEHR